MNTKKEIRDYAQSQLEELNYEVILKLTANGVKFYPASHVKPYCVVTSTQIELGVLLLTEIPHKKVFASDVTVRKDDGFLYGMEYDVRKTHLTINYGTSGSFDPYDDDSMASISRTILAASLIEHWENVSVIIDWAIYKCRDLHERVSCLHEENKELQGYDEQ